MTAADVAIGWRSRERATEGEVTVLHERDTKYAGRAYRLRLTVPGLKCVIPQGSEVGGALAQLCAEAMTAHYQRGEDVDGDKIATAPATLTRRVSRRKQWAGQSASAGKYLAYVQKAKSKARRDKTRARIGAPTGRAGLLARFMLGFGWYDTNRGPSAPTGTSTVNRQIFGTVGGEFKVRNQRGAKLYPPLSEAAARGGLESGLFANNLKIQFMGGRTGQARVGIFFPAQREEYVKWAESQGYVLADAPREVDGQIDAMLQQQAGLLSGLTWKEGARAAMSFLQRTGNVVEWAFGG